MPMRVFYPRHSYSTGLLSQSSDLFTYKLRPVFVDCFKFSNLQTSRWRLDCQNC